MGDYEEQQSMEIEALESILMDDLKEVRDSIPSGWKPQGTVYRIEILPQLGDTDPSDAPVSAEMVFTHTPSYPDEPPLIKARSVRGLSDTDISSLQSLFNSQVEENLGMPMIFTILTAAQEWINDLDTSRAAPVIDPEAERRKRQEEEEARIAALRAHGTPVTPETFNEWRASFDAEMELSKTAIDEQNTSSTQGKLTGKQWFLQQDAHHIAIEEPFLDEDDEDGEGSRSDWSGERHDEIDEYLSEEYDDDDDEMLDSYLNTTTAA